MIPIAVTTKHKIVSHRVPFPKALTAPALPILVIAVKLETSFPKFSIKFASSNCPCAEVLSAIATDIGAINTISSTIQSTRNSIKYFLFFSKAFCILLIYLSPFLTLYYISCSISLFGTNGIVI